jgi:phosphatidylglycerol:prolipoprotein diacylglycerol transferase
MYPEIFTIPGTNFAISSFGVMLALAFLTGAKIAERRMQEENLDPELAWTLLLYVMLGGIGGSKLYFAIDMWLREGGPFLSYLLSRGGITWYGGLIGAVALGGWGAWRHGLSAKVVADCCAISSAVGQAMGRIGCFLVGDDYGVPTDVPWGVEFPEGLPPTLNGPVHPTQLYEVAWLLPVAFFLWKRRKQSPFLFGEYVALNGLGRLVIENWRTNPSFAGFTEPQWIGIGLMVVGIGGWLYYRSAATRA